MKIRLTIDKQYFEIDANPNEKLLTILRELKNTSVKEGCGDGKCGACTVLVDGKPIPSCQIPIGILDEAEIETLDYFKNEIGDNKEKPHNNIYDDIMIGLKKSHIHLCGFCEAEKVLSIYYFLEKNYRPTKDDCLAFTENMSCNCTERESFMSALIQITAEKHRREKANENSIKKIQENSIQNEVIKYKKENYLKNEPTIFKVKTLSELLKLIEKENDIKIIGSCTAIKNLPEKCVSIRNLSELKTFEKWDRRFTFGSALTLEELENQGEQKLPELIYEAIKTIGNKFVKNIATIGGNILSSNTLTAPLLALDARLEFARGNETKDIPILKLDEFLNNENGINWLLTKIKIPNEDWEVKIFKRIEKNSFAFLADIQDGNVISVRIAFSGIIKLRNIDFENSLSGISLPLSSERIENALENGKKLFDREIEKTHKKNVSPLLRTQFLNMLQYSLEQLT